MGIRLLIHAYLPAARAVNLGRERGAMAAAQAPSGEGGTGWFYLVIVGLFVCSGTMQPLLISTLGYNGAYDKSTPPPSPPPASPQPSPLPLPLSPPSPLLPPALPSDEPQARCSSCCPTT